MKNTLTLYAVGIIEDNEALRNNIVSYLDASTGYFTSFSASGFDEIKNRKHDCKPDFILLDIHLQDKIGIELIADIKKLFPDTSIIIMTGDQDESFILRAFENGAKGYLYKPFAMADIITTMQSLISNGSYLPPVAATKLIGLINKAEPAIGIKQKFNLTERENEIIELIKEGLPYQAIADKLFISYHTVNHHLKNVYAKMQVKSRSELIAHYMLHNR